MAGSPKRRARREAARMAAIAAQESAAAKPSPAAPGLEIQSPNAQALVPAPAPRQEVLAPLPDSSNDEPTRTMLRRAKRAKALEYADAAIEVLAANMKSTDPRIAGAAAKDILEIAGVAKAPGIDVGDGAQVVVIQKFIPNGEPASE